MDKTEAVREVLNAGPVIPVILIDDLDTAVPLAQALVAGGVRVLEITLRTDVAMDAIRRIKDAVPEAIVGAGTVVSTRQLEAVEAEGVAFAVSPGVTTRLLDAAEHCVVPLLPGSATASEVMTLLERGYRYMKLFPAEAAGGIDLLRSLASPLPGALFCPTGGINAKTAEDYLALPNVVCVGGSWLLPKDAVQGGDWQRVTELARAASRLGGKPA